jgi:hypothetical protein
MFAVEVKFRGISDANVGSPQHIAGLRIGDRRDISFTTAKFNTGPNEKETTIVARYHAISSLQT